MKRSTLVLGLGLMAITGFAQQDPGGFTIEGNVKGISDPYVYLSYKGHLDSSAVTDGKFAFKGEVSEPIMAMLYLPNYKSYERLFLENSKMTVAGDDLAGSKVNGSKSQKDFDAYNASMETLSTDRQALYKQLEAAKKAGNKQSTMGLEKKMANLSQQSEKVTGTFIKAHPDSYVSMTLLQSLSYGTPYQELKALYDGLGNQIKNSASGTKFAKELVVLEKTAVGKNAIPFTQKDTQGKEVSLADFKGKYVLVDFWASWCGPCRAENPNVVKAYNAFKDKGFTVLGVSLDNNDENWKAAIEQDKLDWTQVSDLLGWKNTAAQAYGVSGIPANYLIDPNGRIVGKNLRGEALEAKLRELLD